MLTIFRSQLPVPEADLLIAFHAYVEELVIHRASIGVPAPLPQYEILRDIAAADKWEIVDDPGPVPPPADGKSQGQTIVDLIKADPAASAALNGLTKASSLVDLIKADPNALASLKAAIAADAQAVK